MNTENLPAVTRSDGSLTEIRGERIAMPEFEPEENRSGLNLHDILFALFRHKWKIVCCAAIGLLSAAALYLLVPPVYESEAKLFVRYVLDKSAIDGLESQVKTPDTQNETLINSEVEILNSSDLVRQVVEAVGPQRLVPGSGAKATIDKAVDNIYHSLQVSVVKGTNIISVSFKSVDPDLPMPVVQELVKRYFDKHLEVHRSVGAFDFVTKETSELRNELDQTEQELKQLKEKAGIISLAEAKVALATELGKTQQDLDAAETDLVAQQARVKDLEKSLAVTSSTSPGTPVRPVSIEAVQEYQGLVNRLAQLQQAETELLSKYTAQNRIVKVKHAQIDGLEKQRRELVKKYPGLVDVVPFAASSQGGPQSTRPDITSERAILAGMESKVEALRARLTGLQERTKLISEVAPRIEELDRKREVEETNYKHSQASLEKARIDETLDPSRMPNISVVQTPSLPTKVKRNMGKLLLGLAGGGFGLGIAVAVLIELVLDRTVKRSLELEKRLHIPLLLSIPYLGPPSRLRLHDARHDSELGQDEDIQKNLVPSDAGEMLRPFCEAIRDRLGIFFEVNNMSHRPKLVAVAGLAKNAGTSTLAAGLAEALSEGAEGKVLLVDKPAAPKKFYNMLADFKASELDYVVFDMPSLGDTSATLPLAGFMDTVLLVVEAEKSNRDAVKRAYTQLAAKTKVSVVFNKSRSYGPKWLEGELS
jgi:polysaccharide biosynthesis transport protein